MWALWVEAGPYDGLIVQEVEVTCIPSEELAKLIRRQILIEPGDLFSRGQKSAKAFSTFMR